MIEKKIADKIKHLREEKGFTLSEFSDLTGLSNSLLSRIENYHSVPPIGTLAKIAAGFGVPLALFFEENEEDGSKYTITRTDDRKPIARRPKATGFTYFSIDSMSKPHVMDAFIVKYPPKSERTAKSLYEHPGEELIFNLRGEIKITYADETIILRKGDSMHFDPSHPHNSENAGEEEAECLVVVVGEKIT